MAEPLILALDIGTSSCRAALFDITARRAGPAATQHDYPLLTSRDGMAEIEPGAMLGAVRGCITEVLHGRRADAILRGRPIAGIGVSCLWHSMVGCTEKGEAITRIMTADDSRCREAAEVLRKRFDERKVHARTGCMLRPDFWPAKMAWLQRIEARLFARVRQWMSPAEWLQLRLAGDANCAIGMATGTGLFDPAAVKWDAGMLKSAELAPENLRPLSDAPASVGGALAQEFPELRGVPWFPGIGDGVAGTLGLGAARAGHAAIQFGGAAAIRVARDGLPAAPFGMGCFRVDAARHFVDATVSNGGNLRTWCMRELRLTDGPGLEAALAARPGPQHGLVVLPSWNGERSPSWDDDARGTIHGIRQSTTALDILQAVTEAKYHRIARALEVFGENGNGMPKLIVNGAITKSASCIERLANVLGHAVYPCDEPEPCMRGAAVFALEKLGYPVPVQKLVNPVKPRKAAAHEYADARARQRRIEELLAS
ncbi:MAG: FGGY family carbohydrate kinase [Chthoniobacteraceae bacterium]